MPAPAEHLRAPDSGRQPSLARARNLTPLHTATPSEHADSLIAWMRSGGITGRVLAEDAQRLYGEMCLDSESALLPWQPIACELRARLGGRKTFCWYRATPTSEPHRLRFYDLSLVAPGDSAARSRPPGAVKGRVAKHKATPSKKSKQARRPAPRSGVVAPNMKDAA